MASKAPAVPAVNQSLKGTGDPKSPPLKDASATKKSVLSDKEEFSADKIAHMGDKPAPGSDDHSKTGQGQGQSKGKPQTPPM